MSETWDKKQKKSTLALKTIGNVLLLDIVVKSENNNMMN